METNDSLILLTDKYGKRDRTADIEKISFNSSKNLWMIQFKGTPRQFSYKKENVEIVKNCLNEKNSNTVFDYLLHMAQYSDIQNDEGQNLLVKNLEKSKFINKNSVLAAYLNPQGTHYYRNEYDYMIFPFGCNNSQYKAVKTALENQISIIQGPPGTGKTQTILNIVSNLLMKKKTVLIVSNNNSATANVYEKLSSEKYGLGFLCATHGKRENVEHFLGTQKLKYPEYINEWKNYVTDLPSKLSEKVMQLRKYFEANERISEINSELSAIEIEGKYLSLINSDIYDTKKLKKKKAAKLMTLLQEVEFEYLQKERLSFISKFKLKYLYGITNTKLRDINPEKIIDTIKFTYYPVVKKELEEELCEKKEYLKYIDTSTIYDQCLKALKYDIAWRCTKKGDRTQFKDGKDIFMHPEAFAKEYPIILSTTFSSRATIGLGKSFLFDYVIMDEASQIDVVTGALAISCARNAVIVGDKMQLPNVIEESKKKIVIEEFSKTGLPEGYNFIHSFLESIERVLPQTPQTLLREHYRCHPKIINFCNQQFYGGKLLIMTQDKGEKNTLEAIKTIPGDFCKDRYNQRQIDVIKKEILPKYTREEIDNLGIIAPYNNQVRAICSQIEGVDSATVHKYQGREKDNIIISTVDNEITSFSDDSNMLNVAVSRAKKKLAIVISGNKQPANSNLSALLKYINYNNFNIEESKVTSIFDYFYTKQTKAKLEYLRLTKKISDFETENIMSGLLTKIFSESRYSRFSFVFEMPLKEVVNRLCCTELPKDLEEFANRSWSHVDFTIFNRVTKEILFGIEVDGYTYHKQGTKQAERDIKKNKIFELIGIPLLRLSTKGSEEENRIKEQLEIFLN